MNVVLLGTAPSSMQLAPFGNPEWEIWGCSPGTYGCPRIDKFFELHRWEPHQHWFSDGYMEFLKNYQGEVIMTEMVEEIPGCKVLDHGPLIEKYGPYFFTSSLAWMFAMAIEAGAKKIALYGVDMAANTEYHDQRLGCQYFALLARARGIEVGVPPESDLFRPGPLYGLNEQSHGWIKQRARNIELARRLNDSKEKYQSLQKEIMFLEGAIDDQDWNLHSWFGAVDTLGREFCTVPYVPALADVVGKKANGSAEEVDIGPDFEVPPEMTKPKRGRPRKNA